MTKITIIDYGVGNLASLRNAFTALKVSIQVSSDIHVIYNSERLILPGVGAFAPAMQKLKQAKLVEPILGRVKEGVPLLGICLGMQLLFTKSYEQGEWPGLNVIPGVVRKFEGMEKIPHIGWNVTNALHNEGLFSGISGSSYFYYVHSYYCLPKYPEHVAAECQYGSKFCAAVEDNHIWGVQFHPEKSQKDGLRILQNFASF